MRFMMLIHTVHDGGQAPTPELMAAMHEMARGEVAAGRMIFDGGLAPPDAGKRVRVKGRKLAVLDGPFAETKEAIGGFAVFEVADMAEAEACARRFMQLHVDHMPAWEGMLEIRQVAGSQVEMIRAGVAAGAPVCEAG